MKNNSEKWFFDCKKWNFEPIRNSVHTAEYLSLRKSLLSRIYVKVKEYTTITKSVYNIYKESHTLHGMIFIYIFEDSTDFENFILISLMTYLLKLYFSLDVSIFIITDKEKKEKNQFIKCFWRVLVIFEDKIVEIHKHSWLSITWIVKKIALLQAFVEFILEIKLSRSLL